MLHSMRSIKHRHINYDLRFVLSPAEIHMFQLFLSLLHRRVSEAARERCAARGVASFIAVSAARSVRHGGVGASVRVATATSTFVTVATGT